MSDDYSDIINMNHHISLKHPHMTIKKRAFQFAPFDALSGYSDSINNEGRITYSEKELDENEKEVINSKFKIICNHINEKPEVIITYFLPDKVKRGGKYISKKGIIKNIDLYNRKIVFFDKTKVYLDSVINIKCSTFNI